MRRPSARATLMAQPGSVSWRQSLKRHCASSSTISAKVSLMPSPESVTPISRIPGVSISVTPSPRSISCLWVVVWRPSPSSSRISAVFMTSRPARAFIRVDLPAPEEPRRQIVTPGFKYSRNSSNPSSKTADTTCTLIPGATVSASTRKLHVSSHRSAFVSITTGVTPPSSATLA